MLPGLTSVGVGAGCSMLPACAASRAAEWMINKVRMNEQTRLYLARRI